MDHLLKPFDLKADAVLKLEGYDSINYRVTSGGKNYVIKFYKNSKDFELIQAEILAIQHVAESITYELPVNIKQLHKFEDGSFVRLLPYIKGSLLLETEQSIPLWANLGKSIGQLTNALVDFEHPVIAARQENWDLQYALHNQEKTKFILDNDRRQYVESIFDQFQQLIYPIQHTLRHATIHGDINDQNVLVGDGQILGIIDFGDICFAPIVYEIAIAMTYVMMINIDQPLFAACQVLKGYQKEFALTKEEINLLSHLIPTRLAVSVSNSAERKANSIATDYILKSEGPAWALIEKWPSFSQATFKSQLLHSCGLSLN